MWYGGFQARVLRPSRCVTLLNPSFGALSRGFRTSAGHRSWRPRKGRLRAGLHHPVRRPPTGSRRNGRFRVDSEHPNRHPHRDSSETPPRATNQTPAVLADDPEDSPAAKPSTFTPQDDIKLVDEYKVETKRIEIDLLQWDYDMKYGQIRKLNGKLWREIMGTFGTSPPMQPGNVVVLQRPRMPTPVTRT